MAMPPKDASAAFERLVEKRPSTAYLLRLYISGTTPRSVEAISAIKKVCAEHLEDRYELEVIDIYQQPGKAREGQIVALPTLVKVLPTPLRRIIGDLSDTERVLVGLDLIDKAG